MDSSGPMETSGNLDDFMGIYLVENKARDNLWEEIGRFPGHDQRGARDLFDLFDLGGIEQKGHLISPRINKGEGLCHVTVVVKYLLVVKVFLAETQAPLQDEAREDEDVKLL